MDPGGHQAGHELAMWQMGMVSWAALEALLSSG